MCLPSIYKQKRRIIVKKRILNFEVSKMFWIISLVSLLSTKTEKDSQNKQKQVELFIIEKKKTGCCSSHDREYCNECLNVSVSMSAKIELKFFGWLTAKSGKKSLKFPLRGPCWSWAVLGHAPQLTVFVATAWSHNMERSTKIIITILCYDNTKTLTCRSKLSWTLQFSSQLQYRQW